MNLCKNCDADVDKCFICVILKLLNSGFLFKNNVVPKLKADKATKNY
jgi:hypothetical protein